MEPVGFIQSFSQQLKILQLTELKKVTMHTTVKLFLEFRNIRTVLGKLNYFFCKSFYSVPISFRIPYQEKK